MQKISPFPNAQPRNFLDSNSNTQIHRYSNTHPIHHQINLSHSTSIKIEIQMMPALNESTSQKNIPERFLSLFCFLLFPLPLPLLSFVSFLAFPPLLSLVHAMRQHLILGV